MPTITGTIERITFENPDTHFVVARFRLAQPDPMAPDGVTRIIGLLPGIHPGEALEAGGAWEAHSVHGLGFRVSQFRSLPPITMDGIRRYLGSGLIPGIGPAMATRIVQQFGEGTLDVIENEPERLREVRGISEKKLAVIAEAWAEQKGIKNVMLFLQSHEVSIALAARIYKHFAGLGEDPVAAIQADPYRLEREVFGIGFKTADGIARKLGLPEDSPERIAAGVKFALSQATSDGHVYLPEVELIHRSCEALGVDEAGVIAAIPRLRAQNAVIVDGDRVYLAPFFLAEIGVARRIRALQTSPSAVKAQDRGWESLFAELAEMAGLVPTAQQRQAIEVAVSNKVAVLTGGPGTGKTTTMRLLIRLLEKMRVPYCLTAPTGRAAKRLAEATDRPAATIHRLLEFQPAKNDFAYNEGRPLPYYFVILDEASMIDLLLLYNVVKAVRPEAHLLLVGDADQLPSVGPGLALRDLIESEAVPVVRLERLFRQAEQSAIIRTAHQVNRGESPEITNAATSDFFFVRAETPESCRDLVADLVARRLPARYGFDPISDIQVLSPMHRGPAGVAALNELLQLRLNPAREGEEMSFGPQHLRLGDKVMQIRNNYDKQVFNGDLGRVVEVDPEFHQITVEYPDPRLPLRVTYRSTELDEVQLAYAISIHKAQGSEYPAVVVPLLPQHYMLLQRNLLYTAITRARKLCVLVGHQWALQKAVETNHVEGRFTALGERLRQAYAQAVLEL